MKISDLNRANQLRKERDNIMEQIQKVRDARRFELQIGGQLYPAVYGGSEHNLFTAVQNAVLETLTEDTDRLKDQLAVLGVEVDEP